MIVVVSDGGERIDGGEWRWLLFVQHFWPNFRVLTVVTVADTTAAAATAVARFKRSKILSHCFSTLDGICWAAF